ncbi:MAG: discoidin domain-containing protein [Bacteroidales bacterium]|nr:discoidin domain-containing protein [Bacteroidales bacterium]
MKNKLRLVITTLISVMFTITAVAQNHYTPYDDAPKNIKSYKPAFQDSYPEWAKMLYDYPVNFNEICDAFDQSEEKDIKTPITRYFKNWRRHIQPWANNDGFIELPDMDTYNKNLRNTQLAANNDNSNDNKSESDWTFLGPKETFWLNESGSPTPPSSCPWQVNVYSFDIAASDNSILYCGTETGFVNKSINYGNSWQQSGLNYSFGSGVTATAIHPTDPNIVYVAAGNQIHKTMDGGIIWLPLLEGSEQFHADRLIIDHGNPAKIYAASTSGVYVTADAGENWNRNYNSRAYDVAINPENENTVYALSKSGGKFEIIISTNGGEDFETDPNFPTDISDESGGMLAVTPADPNTLWVVMLSADYTPYIYKGDMNSQSWELLATGQTSQFPMNNGQGYFDLALEVSPTDADLIFVGTTTLFKSSNGGENFHAIGGYTGPFMIHPDIQDMKLLPNGSMWLATDGGITFTNDHFSNTNNYFSKTNGIIGSDMWGFDQGWNEDVIVGGRYHNGNTAIADFYGDKALRMGGAESPTGWVIHGKSRHVAFNDLGNGWILPSTADGQPEGRFIFSKYPTMDEYGGRRGNLVFHPNYHGIIYLGDGDGFWRSKDMGTTWDLLHDFNQTVRYLQISYHNPDVIYTDVVGRGLYRSADGGITWTQKPSLTSSEYGGSYWKGKTFFVISPTNEDVIYACLQNGTWTADIGEIFKSTDGGDTWEDWTGDLSEYTKNMIIQPDANGNDIVYLFTNARNGKLAKVYKRTQDGEAWELFNDNYPAGFYVNLGIPFFRDSKLRVGGSGGVWESPMAVEDFLPIINPWVNAPVNNCMEDTLYFDDHSILNHEGVSWHWDISPEPQWIENTEIRNPKVVLGNPGSYSVILSVTKNGTTYSKEIIDMVTTSTCPSIEDCFNPAELPKNIWELVYVDSEETNYPGLAIMAFDDDPSTIWHTKWSAGEDPYPHEIQVDMGQVYQMFDFTYMGRPDGQNGRIKEYELYISEDLQEWGMPISIGEFENTGAPQTIVFEESVIGQYFRLVALSEVNGNAWASAAEFSMVGCTDLTSIPNKLDVYQDLQAFPIPSSGHVNITLPSGNTFDYSVVSTYGKIISQGTIQAQSDSFSLSLETYPPGIYIVQMMAENGVLYRVKLIKE